MNPLPFDPTEIAKKAWSMWLVYFGVTVEVAEYFFPFVESYLPTKWWVGLLILIAIARIVPQKGLSKPADDE